eukprot:g1899.t1
MHSVFVTFILYTRECSWVPQPLRLEGYLPAIVPFPLSCSLRQARATLLYRLSFLLDYLVQLLTSNVACEKAALKTNTLVKSLHTLM